MSNSTCEMSQEVKIDVVRSEDYQANFDTKNIDNKLSYRVWDKQSELEVAFELFALYSARRSIAYGIWTTEDGREVVFNREYQPILQRVNGVNKFADPSEFIKGIIKTEYLFGDHNCPIFYIRSKFNKDISMTSKEKKESLRSLKISMAVIAKYTPEESDSVNRRWSIAQSL